MLLVPLGLLCAAAFVAGAVVAGDSAEREAVERFASAWADGDYAAMHDELDAESAARYSAEDLEKAYAEAASTATATAFEIDEPSDEEERGGDTVVPVPVTATTGAFGEVAGEVAVPVADGGVSWQPNLVFPGLDPGEKLVAETKLGKRGPILAADGS
ncbi:MAG: hypothetical protein KJ006_06755, partial [Thermoleophilia bacterium]|nr:hypothetical protein [Thermoleophilia bacterium]